MVFVEITTNIYRSLIFTAIRNLPSVCLKRLSKSFGSTVKIRQNILGLDLKLKHLVVKPFQVFTGTPATLCVV